MSKFKTTDPLIELVQIREKLHKETELIEKAISEFRKEKQNSQGRKPESSVKLAEQIRSKILPIEDQILGIIKEQDKPLKISEIREHLRGNGVHDMELIRSAKRRLRRKGKLLVVKFDSNNHFTFHFLPEMINLKSMKLVERYLPQELPEYAKTKYEIVNLDNIENSIEI